MILQCNGKVPHTVANMIGTPNEIAGYTVLPLSISPTPATSTKPSTHYLYLRPNAPKIPTDSTDREIFVVNVPIDSTESHFRSLFADQLGGARIERVEFDDAPKGSRGKKGGAVAGVKRKRGRHAAVDAEEAFTGWPTIVDRPLHQSGSSAVLVVVDTAAAESAMKEAKRASKRKHPLVWAEGTKAKLPALGSQRYLSYHQMRYPDPVDLQRNVDAFMAAFTSKEETKKRLLTRQRQVPDQDGFITVTRGGRVGPARLEESMEKLEKQKARQVGKEDFYRFQMREKRKERAGELARAFDEDRRKVDMMKRKRNKFRPE